MSIDNPTKAELKEERDIVKSILKKNPSRYVTKATLSSIESELLSKSKKKLLKDPYAELMKKNPGMTRRMAKVVLFTIVYGNEKTAGLYFNAKKKKLQKGRKKNEK